MPKRICLGTPGHQCKQLVDAGIRRCERCRATTAAHRNARPIARLYSSTAYKQLRTAVLERDQYRCRYCGQPARSGDPLTLAHLDETQIVIAQGDNPLDETRCITGHRSCAAKYAPSQGGVGKENSSLGLARAASPREKIQSPEPWCA